MPGEPDAEGGLSGALPLCGWGSPHVTSGGLMASAAWVGLRLVQQ
jgi:hypothetical protein